MFPSTLKNRIDNGYIWDGDSCACCPYGYHIDLDFVRYCEYISQEADRTGSVKRKKDRRQRQSMEVMLGITPTTVPLALENNYKPNKENEVPQMKPINNTHFSLNQDSFDDAISDFERTLQRSKNKVNLPDVTAVSETIKRVPSNSSISSASGSSMTVLPENTTRDFDASSVESYGLSPSALQSIREQMAISLERTKHLEEQVKLIPQLKDQLLSLKEENRILLLKLKAEKTQNTVNTNYHDYLLNNYGAKSQYCNDNDILNDKKVTPLPRKDFGINCVALTRSIGVGHQAPNARTTSTSTFHDSFKDNWLYDKNKLLSEQKDKNCITKSTQTLKEIREIASQTFNKSLANSENFTQTPEKLVSNASVSVYPQYRDCSVQKHVEVYNVGISDDTINDIICEKCNVLKRSIGIGADNNVDLHTNSVSLASLKGIRSKSFNLGKEQLNLSSRSKSVACQYDPCGVNKESQYESTNISRSCQCETKVISKSCQCEIKRTEKSTQYENAKIIKPITAITDGENINLETKNLSLSNLGDDKNVSPKCKHKESEDFWKKDGTLAPSKIPRPQMQPIAVENRKFRRQDTYTKIYSPPNEKSTAASDQGLSGLDLSQKSSSTDLSNSLHLVKKNLQLPESTSQLKNVTPKSSSHESALPLPETTLLNLNPIQPHRKKVVPSKEMQGALKVLNDSLHKSHTNQSKNLKNQNAVFIVQQEWFKISSLYTANPLDVEDYLDAFEEISSVLLEYIVNMPDESGNTAMHYAVSHGNFDVVSILLDSKVCDINKPNKAGYTSVMLVSLAEIKSQTHTNVVRKLFQLADVNIRAKQHGQTALMLAVSHGRLDMVKMLLEAGADINIQDEDGSTALMCAAEHGHIDIVKHFLSHPECDSSITDIDGSTALKIAMEAGHRHIGVLLYAHQRNLQGLQGKRKSKSSSPKTLSPLPTRSSHRALLDTKDTK